MPQSFFVVSGENVELARDEVIAISKSYDTKTSYKTDSRLVITNSTIPWSKISQRATFVRTAGKIASTFSDLFSEADLSLMHKPETFACRAINLTSKKMDLYKIEKTTGDAKKQTFNIAKNNLSSNEFDSRVINAGYEYLQKIKDKIDGIVTNLPYGTASKSSQPPKKLFHDFISILPKKKKIAIMYKKEMIDQ